MSTDNKDKKEWRKPELIVLLRNMPEEAVLQSCKFSSGAGPIADELGCDGGTAAGYTVDPCFEPTTT